MSFIKYIKCSQLLALIYRKLKGKYTYNRSQIRFNPHSIVHADPQHEDMFEHGNYKRRKRMKRPSIYRYANHHLYHDPALFRLQGFYPPRPQIR